MVSNKKQSNRKETALIIIAAFASAAMTVFFDKLLGNTTSIVNWLGFILAVVVLYVMVGWVIRRIK